MDDDDDGGGGGGGLCVIDDGEYTTYNGDECVLTADYGDRFILFAFTTTATLLGSAEVPWSPASPLDGRRRKSIDEVEGGRQSAVDEVGPSGR